MTIGKGIAFMAVSVALVGMAYFHINDFAILIVGVVGFFLVAASN